MKHSINQVLEKLIPLMTAFEYEDFLNGLYDIVETNNSVSIQFHRQMAM